MLDKMKYLLLLIYMTSNVLLSKEWDMKYSGFAETTKIIFNSGIEIVNFRNNGTWDDSLGNYGDGLCQGMATIEKNKNNMEFYCEYSDQDNDKFFVKGIRKSDINAGVGKLILLDGTGKWTSFISSECAYAVKYKGKSFFVAQKCKLNK